MASLDYKDPPPEEEKIEEEEMDEEKAFEREEEEGAVEFQFAKKEVAKSLFSLFGDKKKDDKKGDKEGDKVEIEIGHALQKAKPDDKVSILYI